MGGTGKTPMTTETLPDGKEKGLQGEGDKAQGTKTLGGRQK